MSQAETLVFFYTVSLTVNSDSRVSDRCKCTPRQTHIFLSTARHMSHFTLAQVSSCVHFLRASKKIFTTAFHGTSRHLTPCIFRQLCTTSAVSDWTSFLKVMEQALSLDTQLRGPAVWLTTHSRQTLSEVQADRERKNREQRSPEMALYESHRELESQKLLFTRRINGQIKLKERRSACVDN